MSDNSEREDETVGAGLEQVLSNLKLHAHHPVLLASSRRHIALEALHVEQRGIVDLAGTITLEGGLAHVPSFVAPSLLTLVEQLQRAMPPLTDEQAWKRSAAELPVPLIAGILELRSNPPLPEPSVRCKNTNSDATSSYPSAEAFSY